jgi:hypothetical protein
LPPQRGDNLPTVIGPLFVEDVLADAFPDVPVERGKARTHSARHAFAGLLDQSPQVRQQRGWLLGWHNCRVRWLGEFALRHDACPTARVLRASPACRNSSSVRESDMMIRFHGSSLRMWTQN